MGCFGYRVLAVAALSVFAGVVAAVGQEPNFVTGPYATEQDYFNEVFASTTRISLEESVGLIRAVELEVSDQVDGGCWTNSSAVAARVRAELEKAGIAVYEEPLAFYGPFSPSLRIAVLGFKSGGANGICAGYAKVEAYYIDDTELGSLANTGKVFRVRGVVSSWNTASLFTSGSTLNAQISEYVQESIDTLIADVLSARRIEGVKELIDVWDKDPPMTRKQWDEYLETTFNR
jgi:hypothetical protein